MKILVLGGTQFSGLHLVRAAVARGDDVTVVHRGKHDAGLPVGVRRIMGDRDPTKASDELPNALGLVGDLIAAGERWDAVVDMCGYVPRVVSASCTLLKEATDRYVFVSTVSVYPVSAGGAPDETSAVIELDDPDVEEVTGETYGGLKVLCERVVDRVFGKRSAVVRPGLIVGPGDMTDRFTYWPRRLYEGGRVLVPCDGLAPTRWIDGRDLASFMLRCVHEGFDGTMNVCGPREPLALQEFLREVGAAVGGKWEAVEIDESVLAGADVLPWRDVPMWAGVGGASMMQVRADRAFGVGLETRSLAETARDTLDWDRERGLPGLKAGISRDRETELLADSEGVSR
ncbi:MAG: NAD-dependent epimerase/dehydratase family protein [Phycisphaerales bacterium]